MCASLSRRTLRTVQKQRADKILFRNTRKQEKEERRRIELKKTVEKGKKGKERKGESVSSEKISGKRNQRF